VAAAPPAPAKPEVTVATVEIDTAGNVYVAGTATPDGAVRVYLDDKPIGDATAASAGTWLVQTTRDLPAGNYTVRADQLDSSGAVLARSEVPFQREVEVADLKPAATAGAGQAGAAITGQMAMETVVIKRGDNLWRIARGTWGKGIRWSTIYQANNDQIRNPHWIYPGQIFIMPKGNTTWTD
jgi:nucleoid-associated protein YgaU